MQSTIKKITNKWSEAGIIAKSDEDIYEYGLELIFTSVINIVAILVTAAFISKLPESISLLVIVIPLQSCAGGYHAKTHLRCFLVMYIGWWGVIFLLPYVTPIIAVIAVCISVVIIVLLAPAPHIFVKMSETQKRKMRKFSIIIVSVAAFSSIFILCFVSARVGTSVAVGIGVSALSIFIARLKNEFDIRRA